MKIDLTLDELRWVSHVIDTAINFNLDGNPRFQSIAHRAGRGGEEAIARVSVLNKIKTAIEWSSEKRGPGSGPMFSGGDGTLWAACGECRGLKPGDGVEREFIREAIGHRPTCSLYREQPA